MNKLLQGLKLCLSSVIVVCLTPVAFAERPLPLTDAQIEKLKQHIPLKKSDRATLTWKGEPLQISLPLGIEKRLVFFEPIEVNFHGKLTTDELSIINNDQSLYMTALSDFSKARMYVTLKESNKIILIDLNAEKDASAQTQKIKLENASGSLGPINNGSYSNTMAVQQKSYGLPETADSYVRAIRFAWQQLYSPKHAAIESDYARTPMYTQKWVHNLVYGDKVLVHPIASWSADNFYVTALELRNKYPTATKIQIERDLCGHWQSATLYPSGTLKASGDVTGDSTTLFLISNRPFGEEMEVCDGRA